MSKTIGVLGCGWLGYPLALSLLDKGFVVRGTTTSSSKLDQLKMDGIEPYQIGLGETEIQGPIDEFLNGLDVIVINVPPGLRRDSNASFYRKMMMLHQKLNAAGIKKVVFVSSTSVYGNVEGEVTEDSTVNPATESGRQLVQTESLLMEDTELNTTVIRFGGLIGPDRHPVRQLAGRKGLSNGDDVVNLIHLDDCIHMIYSVINNNWWGKIFNGVFPDHPSKAEYYTAEAVKFGLVPPEYQDVTGIKQGKLVISRNFLINNGQFYTSIHS